MAPVIFLGPSLGQETARNILPLADFRPPARKGDFVRLAKEGTRFVGFIDGVFLQDYPPTPMEVYEFLQHRNVVLLGAASLGALRAVELEKYGMVGVGKIFELYKNGIIDSDDEVAVTFSEQDYKLQSEALIDIRYTLYHAFKDGIVDKNTKRILIRTAKKIYFPNRNYQELFEHVNGRIDHATLRRLKEYLSANRKSLKAKDSTLLLKMMKEKYFQSLRKEW